MKRTCLISSALATLVLVPVQASAEPAVLFIPTEEVSLQPDGEGECAGVGSPNSAFNCTAAVDAATVIPPFAGDLDAFQTSLQDSLLPYDVLVTNTRPPEYLPYTMLLPEVDVESFSLACSFGGINCGARKRNSIVFLVPQTDNCTDPDMLQQALYAFGRISGLEGVANPMDVMNFPPDFTMPVAGYLDECSDRSPQLNFDKMGMPTTPALLECTSKDHAAGACPDDPEGNPGQNSHQDLLAYYGPRPDVEDTEPPVFANVMPEDGTVLMTNDSGVAQLMIDVDITDADPAVGVRWTVSSDALISDMFPDGVLTICTNDVCSVNWSDVVPAKATDSDWASPVALNFPPGEYAVTLEASDYKGNVADPVSFTVTIEDASSGSGGVDSGADETAGVDTNEPPPFTTGNNDDSGTGDGGSNDGGANDDGGGCSCSTTGGSGGVALMLLGLVGLGAMRRRW
jgi:MYXO-CTERM domain-containing protein